MTLGKLGTVHRDLRALFGTGATAHESDTELLVRFVSRRDDAAFESLMDRHGAMVLSVCRAVLRREEDVEDAFQATFLVLARKAGTLRPGGSLAGWLHQVARRVAVKASIRGARRRDRETVVSDIEVEQERRDDAWRDVVPVLHEELARLPEKYRAPIVLCELESLTRDQAAQQLGCPPGTVAGRLARGRALLRVRLTRRGVAPAAIAGALVAARSAAATTVPTQWLAASTWLARGTAPSPSIDVLVREIFAEMFRVRLRRVATSALMLTTTLAALAALAWARTQADDASTLPVTGIVVLQDGTPAPNVSVFASTLRNTAWGEVVHEVQTDAQGRYELAFPREPDHGPLKPGVIWAYQPGKLLASYPVRDGVLHRDVPIRLVLGPASFARIEVRDPNGKPVVGASIMPRGLSREYGSVPTGLAERIARDTITDDQGRATISACLPEEIVTVQISATGFGTQQSSFGRETLDNVDAKVVQLLPVGRLEGRLVGAPAAIRGVPLAISIRGARSDPEFPRQFGQFYMKTDEDGRFVVPEAPIGTIGVGGTDGLVEKPEDSKIEAGKTTRLELVFSSRALVRGIVREKGSGRPIRGVKIAGLSDYESGTTDGAGRFVYHAPTGRNLVALISTPDGYTRLLGPVLRASIPEGVDEFELPPIELNLARTVRGTVRDAQGNPVAGATVRAGWPVDDGEWRHEHVSVTTDAEGRFEVHKVPVASAARLSASAPLLGRTVHDVIASPEVQGEVALVLESTGLVSMRGRVVDIGRHPVSGAQVHIRRQIRSETGAVGDDAVVDFADVKILHTDALGRFVTPRTLLRNEEYVAIAEAGGHEPGLSPCVTGSSKTFPDVILRPPGSAKLITRAGFVRDRTTRPVVGATVWASIPGGLGKRAAVKTDAQGHFRLVGMPSTELIVFFEAEGFHADGTVLGSDYTPAIVTLIREDEPAAAMKTVAPPLSRYGALAAAEQALDPLVRSVIKERGHDSSTVSQVLSALAAVTPERVLEQLKAKPPINPRDEDSVRCAISRALATGNLDEANTVAETVGSEEMRAQLYCELSDRLPDASVAARIQMLERAIRAGRTIPVAAKKLVVVARVAERWTDLGKRERSTQLLREFQPQAAALPTQGFDGFARGYFAKELAHIDVDAALKLIEVVGEDDGVETDRHRLNLAQEIARRDPAAAERVLDSLTDASLLVRNGPRIVHAMAGNDPARARRIADRMDRYPEEMQKFPFHHAYALGMLALALADSDKAQAERLLEESYAELENLAARGQRDSLDAQDSACVAAALLPVAERIDPRIVPSYFWRATAWRGTADSRQSKAKADAVLALLLARYRPDIAHAILDPWTPGGQPIATSDAPYILPAVAEIDPERACSCCEAFPTIPTPASIRSEIPRTCYASSSGPALRPIGARDGIRPSQSCCSSGRWDTTTAFESRRPNVGRRAWWCRSVRSARAAWVGSHV